MWEILKRAGMGGGGKYSQIRRWVRRITVKVPEGLKDVVLEEVREIRGFFLTFKDFANLFRDTAGFSPRKDNLDNLGLAELDLATLSLLWPISRRCFSFRNPVFPKNGNNGRRGHRRMTGWLDCWRRQAPVEVSHGDPNKVRASVFGNNWKASWHKT